MQVWAGAAAVLLAVFCVTPSIDPDVVTTHFHRDNTSVVDEDVTGTTFKRTTVWFDSQGVRCHAWLYTPRVTDQGAPPVVLMAHGLGSQKDMGLAQFAEAFADKSIASLVFDYRNFGGSDGEPRHIVDSQRHVQDYQAAVEHVQRTSLDKQVDPSRLALWGSSFSGGHVLHAAAKLGDNITCVISQIPALDGRSVAWQRFKEHSWLHYLRMTHAVAKDLGRRLMGLSPAYVKLVGRPGELALLQTSQEQVDTFVSAHKKGGMLGGWQNLAPARLVLSLAHHRPISVVPQIRVPILFVGAKQDKVCPYSLVEKAAGMAPNAQLFAQDCGHIQIYGGEYVKAVIARMQQFLAQNLLRNNRPD